MDANAQSHKLTIFDARQNSVADTNKVQRCLQTQVQFILFRYNTNVHICECGYTDLGDLKRTYKALERFIYVEGTVIWWFSCLPHISRVGD